MGTVLFDSKLGFESKRTVPIDSHGIRVLITCFTEGPGIPCDKDDAGYRQP